MQLPRMSAVAAASDKEIFVLGGSNGIDRFSTGECYNIDKRTWSAMPPMNTPRSGCAIVALADKLLVLGGLDSDRVYNSVEMFSATDGHWRSGPSMQTRRFALAAAILEDQIFAIGGGTGSEILDTVEVIPTSAVAQSGKDQQPVNWEMSGALPCPRLGSGAAVVGGKLFVVGGFNEVSQHLDLVDCFDPQTKVWSSVISMSRPRSSCMVAELNGKLFVCGGYDGFERTKTCEQWDPITSEWSTMQPMKVDRSGGAVVVAPIGRPVL